MGRLHGSGEAADPALARAIAEAYGLGAPREMRTVARPDDMGRWMLFTG